MKKIIIIAQARLTSKRFPGKVLMKIKNKTLIEILYLRLKNSKLINKFIFAIPKNFKNLELKKFLLKKKLYFIEGPEKNVLKRFFIAAFKSEADIIVRLTCDCPLIDKIILEKMIRKFLSLKDIDYMSNTTIVKNKFPDGMDIEIFTYSSLKETYAKAKKIYDKEHVTSYIRKNFKTYGFESNIDYSNKKWSVDTFEDLNTIKKIFSKFKYNFKVKYNNIIMN